MIHIQLYKVIDYINEKYVVDLYSSMYCYKPARIKINRYRFDKWVEGKLDKSELEGNKVKLWEIKKNKSNTIKNTPPTAITDKEKYIMNVVVDKVGNTYAIEKEVCNSIKGYSKALIGRTMKNKDILDMYNLERMRANKKIKEKYNLDTKGYPFLICKK